MARRLIFTLAGVTAALLALIAYSVVVGKYMIRRPGWSPGGRAQVGSRAAKVEFHLNDAEIRLQVMRLRQAIEDSLRTRAATDTTTLVVAVKAEGWRSKEATEAMRRSMQEEWAALGLSVTKVAVGVVVIDRQTARSWAHYLAVGADDPSVYYVLPDSLTPGTCLAIVSAPFIPAAANVIDVGRLRENVRPWLGPCAYYARFGIPGPRVARWLTQRNFDLALYPDWVERGPDTLPLFPGLSPRGESRGWYWDVIYFMSPDAVGCLAGRATACREALRERPTLPGREEPWIFGQSTNSWRFAHQRVTGGDRFLGAVAREVGTRRFQEFWHTTLPVDSALTVALKAPAGAWAAKWERTVAEPPRLGPAPSLGELLVAVALMLFAVGVVARGAARREVV